MGRVVAGGSRLCPATPGLRCCSELPAGSALALGALVANNSSRFFLSVKKRWMWGMLLVSDAEIVVL